MPVLRRVLVSLLFAFTALTFGGVPFARATDYPISAKRLRFYTSITHSGGLPVRVRFTTDDPAFPVPDLSSPDRPDVAGVTIQFITQNPVAGGHLEGPAGPGWRVGGTADRVRYTFQQRLPFERIALVEPRGKSTVFRAQFGRTGISGLGDRGRVAVRVIMGSVRACAVFGPESIVRDGSYVFIGLDAPVPAIPDCSDATLLAAVGRF